MISARISIKSDRSILHLSVTNRRRYLHVFRFTEAICETKMMGSIVKGFDMYAQAIFAPEHVSQKVKVNRRWFQGCPTVSVQYTS